MTAKSFASGSAPPGAAALIVFDDEENGQKIHGMAEVRRRNVRRCNGNGSMRTLPPSRSVDIERPEIIRRVSRHRYARPAAEVEQEIAAALVR